MVDLNKWQHLWLPQMEGSHFLSQQTELAQSNTVPAKTVIVLRIRKVRHKDQMDVYV